MGLLDYYRQFSEMDPQEVTRELRERHAEEKAKALEIVPELDLSSTEWPDFPYSEVVNAAIAAARGRVNGYPDRHATKVRRLLAERHGVEPEQIVVGNGAAELLQTAAQILLDTGDELVTAWPSYPLYPLMAAQARAQAVAVDSAGGRSDPDALRAAIGDRTRVVVICNPNDPTGDYLEVDELGALLSTLPDHVHVLLDEALVQFQEVDKADAALRLVDAFPRLLVFRTFSKIYGLSGLRAGYVVGSPTAARTLGALSPVLGVNTLTQAVMYQALKIGDGEVARRRSLVIEQRRRLERELYVFPVDARPSQANFIWLHARGLDGQQLAVALQDAGVIVARGGPLGADDHVRVSIRGAAASERLLSALRDATASAQA